MKRRIFIDTGGETCPVKGSLLVFEALQKAIRKAGLEGQVEVIPRGCFGLCRLAPNLYIEPDGIWYSKFTLEDVPVIVRQHLLKGKPVQRLIHYTGRPTDPNKGDLIMAETLTVREIEVGDTAPDFTLKDENGSPGVLSSFKGQKSVVLMFYPFDWSSVCTTENCAASQEIGKFEQKDTVVFGVSCDSHFSHKAWKEKLGLKQSLLSDLKREVVKKYGLYLEDLNCAKRATVIVDKSGKVVFKKVQEIKMPRDNQEILAHIR